MNPLVSCVMPTWNRRAFIPAAIDCWLKQTYENRELVILDDGEEPIEDLIPDDPRIRYKFDNVKRLTGTKRNKVIAMAKGEIICHWDDDDWSAPGRIEYQVALLQKSGKPMTGFSNLLFWDCNENKAKRYRAAVTGYVCGTSLCFLRSFWQGHPFRDRQHATDNDLVYPNLPNIEASRDASYMVARIHRSHTSRKNGIREVIPNDMIPAAFWDNEKLRLT